MIDDEEKLAIVVPVDGTEAEAVFETLKQIAIEADAWRYEPAISLKEYLRRTSIEQKYVLDVQPRYKQVIAEIMTWFRKAKKEGKRVVVPRENTVKNLRTRFKQRFDQGYRKLEEWIKFCEFLTSSYTEDWSDGQWKLNFEFLTRPSALRLHWDRAQEEAEPKKPKISRQQLEIDRILRGEA